MDIPGSRKNILKNSIAVKIHSSAHPDERDYFIRSQWGVVYVTSEGDCSMKYGEAILSVLGLATIK